jgi:hypothetical protein
MARAPLRVRDEKKGIKAYGPGVCVCSLAARRFCVSLCASASNRSVHAKMGHGMALAKSMRAGAAIGAAASFSSVNWGEKHCIRIPIVFRLYLIKII